MFSASSAKKIQKSIAELAQKRPKKNRQQAEENVENASRTYIAVLIYRVPEEELKKIQPSHYFKQTSTELKDTFDYYR